MLLELGGGSNPHPRADLVVDLHHPQGLPPQDATVTPWHDSMYVLADECADEVFASHFIEHIPKGQPLISVMNEAHRVLKPGGSFTLIMPLVGYTEPGSGEPKSNQIGWQPWSDPTHVSFWWLPEAFLYFCEGPFKPHANYGVSIWAPLGDYIREEEATMDLDLLRTSPAPPHDSFWSVRNGWEGVIRLVKGTL